MDKKLIYLGMAIGTGVGGYLPMLWGAGPFSGWGILTSALGGFLGIWAGVKASNM